MQLTSPSVFVLMVVLLNAPSLKVDACHPGLANLAQAGIRAAAEAGKVVPQIVAGTVATGVLATGIAVGVEGKELNSLKRRWDQVTRDQVRADYGDRLYPFQKLGIDQHLVSASHQYAAVLQKDGNFVIYDRNNQPIFSSGTWGESVEYLELHTDGRLVIVNSGSVIWSNIPIGKPGACPNADCVLVMQDDGNLAVYKGETIPQHALWRSIDRVPGSQFDKLMESSEKRNPYWMNQVEAIHGDRLYPFQKLRVNQHLVSSSRQYAAVLQPDGNFLVYDRSRKPNFSTETFAKSVEYLALHTDGRLVIVGSKSIVWSSVPNGRPGTCQYDRCVLVLQDNGNLAVYKGEIGPQNALWSSTNAVPSHQFNALANRVESDSCPVFGRVGSISFDILTDRYKPRLQKRSQSGEFALFCALNKRSAEWLIDMDVGILGSDSNLKSAELNGQQVFYRQRNAGDDDIATNDYVKACIRTENLNQGQSASDSRVSKRRDALLRSTGLVGSGNRDRRLSWDAGHILGRFLGGHAADALWNIFSQNGIVNRDQWRHVEGLVGDTLRENPTLIVVAEYLLQYDVEYPTVPTFVHYAFRFFDSDTGNYVHHFTGMFPNTIVDGQSRTFRISTLLNGEQVPTIINVIENTPPLQQLTDEELNELWKQRIRNGFQQCFRFDRRNMG